MRTLAAVTENRSHVQGRLRHDAGLHRRGPLVHLFGALRGLGLGTIVSALAVGRLCNLFNLHLPLIARIARLTRSAQGAPLEALSPASGAGCRKARFEAGS